MRKRNEYTDLVDKTVTDEEFKTELIAALEKERGGESGSATLAPRPPRRRGGVRVITGVAACLVACACLVMCIIALTRGSGLPVPGGTGTVPIYQGMRVLPDVAVTPSGGARSTADELAEAALAALAPPDAEMPEGADYYAPAGGKAVVCVELYNPDSLPILRFTLNGVIYQSYQFMDGSDSEQLYLEVAIPDTPGDVAEYTIDEIKYVDVDNEIRDARMDGERTVTVGVSYAAPSATITAYAAPDRVELDVELIDAGAIERSGGDVVIAFAEEGGEPVVRKADELMVYEGLDSGVTYRYALAASYDALDGEGEVRRLLYEGSCRTQSYFALTDVFPEKRGVTFAVRPLIAGGVAERVELYDAFGRVAETTPDAPAFDGLLSGHDYTLRLVYSYGSDGDGIEEYAFTTPSVLPPEVTIAEEAVAGKASLAFDVAYSDPDGAITSRTETLYLDGEAVGTGTSFFGLLSGRTYELRVTYTYDLNDGEGVRTATLSREGRTVALTAPSAEISERVTIGKRSLAFDVTCSDPDDTITSESFTLYLAGEAVGAGGTAYYELLSGREYEFVAEYVYDLRDGAGERVLTVRATASTTESVTPTVTLTSISAGDDEITFSLLVSDPDDTLGTILPKLYASGEQVAVTSGNRFVGLDADTLYTIVAEYVYDLHDGAGAREAEASAEVRTALHEVTLVGVTPLMDSGGAVLADENVMLDIRYSTESRIVPKSFVVNGQTCPAVVNEDGRSVVYYVPPVGADEIVVDVTDVQYTHNGVAVKSVVNSSADVEHCLLRVYRKVSPVYVLQSGDYTTSDKGELLIRLDDLGDYVMRSVSLNGETYPVRSVGDNVVAVDVSLPDTGITRFSLDSISYGDADAPVTVAAPGYMAGIAYRVTSVVDVSTADELAAAANDEAGLKAYRLTNDIDLTGVEWVSRPLTHVLDGNGHTVRGLTQIERLNGSNVQRGLFTTCDVGIFDLTLEDVTIVLSGAAPGHYVGGLLGESGANCVIRGCSVSGSIIVPDNTSGYNSASGGLVGQNSGTIIDCASSVGMGGVVSVESVNIYSGGLVGVNNALISYCRVTAHSISNAFAAGGLAGSNGGGVSFCSVTSNVVAELYAGGIVSRNFGTVTHCSFSGNVTASPTVGEAGGIAAYCVAADGGLEYDTVSGVISAARAGGIAAGLQSGSIRRCEVNATIVGGFATGGVVGESNKSSEVSECYVKADLSSVLAEGDTGCNIGGIAGTVGGTLTDCRADVSVNATYGYAGGIARLLDAGGEIRSCLVTGSVYAYRSSGALYECMGTVTDSLSLCTVLSADPDLEGRGFIGTAETSSVIENCYAVNEGPFVPVIDKADVTTQFVYERLGWSPDVWTEGADGLPDLAWRTAV